MLKISLAAFIERRSDAARGVKKIALCGGMVALTLTMPAQAQQRLTQSQRLEVDKLIREATILRDKICLTAARSHKIEKTPQNNILILKVNHRFLIDLLRHGSGNVDKEIEERRREADTKNTQEQLFAVVQKCAAVEQNATPAESATATSETSAIVDSRWFVIYMDRTQLDAVSLVKAPLGTSGGVAQELKLSNDPPSPKSDIFICTVEDDCTAGKVKARAEYDLRLPHYKHEMNLSNTMFMVPAAGTPAEATLDYVCRGKIDLLGGTHPMDLNTLISSYYIKFLGETVPTRFSK